MEKIGAGGAVPRNMWCPPPPAKPSDEVAVFIYKKDPKDLLMQRQRSGIVECPNCHVQYPASTSVKCGCGNVIAKSTCHICGYNLGGEKGRIRLLCPKCRKPVPHTVKQGYSAERLTGMYGGFSAAFSLMFHPNAYSMFERLREELQWKIASLFKDARAGCMVDRCKFATGALVLFFIPRKTVIAVTPERLQELDGILREAGLGYLMPKEEAILAEKKLLGVHG